MTYTYSKILDFIAVNFSSECGDSISHIQLERGDCRDGNARRPTAVTDLVAGDEVLVYDEDVARHFGESVEESIIEK